MSSAYPARMVALLGDTARLGLTGRLLLDAGRGEPGGAMLFARGVFCAYRPPGAAAAYAREALPTLREKLASAAGAPGATADPRFEPLEHVDSPAAGSLTAADLAIEFGRLLDDEAWLKQHLAAAFDETLSRSAAPPVAAPNAALGAVDGFLLSRADGKLTLRQLLDTTPLGIVETLRAVYSLMAVGVLMTKTSLGTERAGDRLSNLDQFLMKTAQAASRHTPEQQRDRERLLALCRDAAGQDHYSILGVDHTAGESAVRHAYYRLARLYHPDRLLKPHLEDIHRELEGMFAAITDAYNTLSHPALRSEYDREVSERMAGRRKPSGQEKLALARDSYLRGRKEMEAGKLFEAIRLFEVAAENDPSRSEYFHHLGVCQGQNPRWRKKAEESLLSAISLNPGSARSYLELARIYQKGGLARRALEMYQKLLQWDPTNQEALNALGRGKDAAGPGLLGGLFRKD